MTPGIVAVIPARAGSKGVPGKNVTPLAGFPLMAYSIAAARLVPEIERVIVSTDSPEYGEIAHKFGAEVPFLRPAELSRDTSTDREFFLHAMNFLQQNEGRTPEYWVHLRPTTPLRDPRIVGQAIADMLSHPGATSLRSGHLAAESPFKWFERDEEGFFRGLRPNDPRPEYYNLPRQAFPKVYVPDGYVDIVRASQVLASESLHGPRIFGFESPVCIEVDTGEDLERLAFHIARNPSPLVEHMKSLTQ